MTKRHLHIILLCIAMVVLSSCAIDTTYSGAMNVIEASDALENFSAQSNVIIIDARGQEAYDKGHLKGAICLSTEALVKSEPIPMTLVAKETFEKVMQDHGISPESVVYIYDDNAGVSASRIWWTMKGYGHQAVQIINGGSSAIVMAKGELTTESTQLAVSTYKATDFNASMVVSYEEIETLVENPKEGVKLLDVRSNAEYAEGFIPGAILYPHTLNLYSDGTFMSARDLGLFYKDAGFEKSDEIIVYCKSSFRATQTVALLEEAGFTNLKIYDGAWLEWSSRSNNITPVIEAAPVGESDGS